MTPAVEITMIGGNCPVQAEGTFDLTPFYFRARGQRWEIWVGADAFECGDHSWRYGEPYKSAERFQAGWMGEDEARAFIAAAAVRWGEDIPF